jgi:hypothetical protein
MRRLSLFSIVVVVGISLMLIGCAKEPSQEIGAAKTAVDAAKTAQADKYLASDFASVQESLNSALADVQKQKSKSPLSRNYDKAKASLVSVAAKATELKAKAAEEMAKVQNEMETTLSKLNAEIAKAKEMTKKAPKAKKAKAQFEAKVKSIAAAEANAATAASMKASADFAGALDAAKAGIATLESAKGETTTKVVKQSKHKSKKRR